MVSQRNKKQAEVVKQIDRALGRLTSHPDLVGLCEDCEEEIPEKRLKLMPYVTLCAECQAKRDPRRGGTRKMTTSLLGGEDVRCRPRRGTFLRPGG